MLKKNVLHLVNGNLLCSEWRTPGCKEYSEIIRKKIYTVKRLYITSEANTVVRTLTYLALGLPNSTFILAVQQRCLPGDPCLSVNISFCFYLLIILTLFSHCTYKLTSLISHIFFFNLLTPFSMWFTRTHPRFVS